ncbi:MAG: zinc-binding dehydrogenase [Deltaproteobacteria bacterium]|nr:zinc-binding dehydrogenase [Deltaproteobacteria bacterium]
MSSARHVVIDRPGGYDRLRTERVELPARPRDHVRIDVEAIGVNYADCVARMGLYESAKKYGGWPLVPGFELSGRVRESDDPSLEVGASVVAVRRFGAYASCVDVPRHQVFALPRAGDRDVTIEEAAGLPVVYATAWYALHPLASIRAGQTLLVHSGAGGVGGAILQLAKQAGCTTVAVVGRSDKIAVAKTLGATHVIDKSREDLWTRARELAPRGYDVVLDANGAETLSRSYDALRSPGRLIVYGFHTMLPRAGESTTGRPSWRRLATSWLRTPRFDPLKLTGQNKSVMGFNLSYLFEERAILEEAMSAIWTGLERGDLTPLPTRTFPFERVADAHRAIESGTTTGKLVLTVMT